MKTKGTEGTQTIEHDWDRIKLSTDRYKVSKMSIKVFTYKIIEDGTWIRCAKCGKLIKI